MKVRDSQKSKVYASERAINNGKRLETVFEMQKYVDKIVTSAWWKKRHSNITSIDVKDGRRRRSATGYRRGQTIILRMPKEHRSELIILHEIAHGATSNDFAFHGMEFCNCYLKLVKRFMKVDAFNKLKESFDNFGVTYE